MKNKTKIIISITSLITGIIIGIIALKKEISWLAIIMMILYIKSYIWFFYIIPTKKFEWEVYEEEETKKWQKKKTKKEKSYSKNTKN